MSLIRARLLVDLPLLWLHRHPEAGSSWPSRPRVSLKRAQNIPRVQDQESVLEFKNKPQSLTRTSIFSNEYSRGQFTSSLQCTLHPTPYTPHPTPQHSPTAFNRKLPTHLRSTLHPKPQSVYTLWPYTLRARAILCENRFNLKTIFKANLATLERII
jgi:hypothetical protein